MVTERRQFERLPCDRAVKLQTGAGGRYFGGRAQNVSAGGALIRLTAPARVIAGDRLRVGLAAEKRAVLATEELVSATVLRAFDTLAGRWVAIRFDEPQGAAATVIAAAA